MKKYKVRVCLPSKTWFAETVMREVEADNLNEVALRGLTHEEYNNGGRIIAIFEPDEDEFEWTRIK